MAGISSTMDYNNTNATASSSQQPEPSQLYNSAAASAMVDEYDDEDAPEFDRTEEEYADEMQRELGDDAPWKRIQQNTFTRWANEHLKLVNRPINDLQHDLSDGLALIGLIEVLSQRKLPRHNRRPAFRSQKLENVSVALDFLENDEHIKLVNIDASHIVDGRLKLILGLIWTLILHYSIQLSTWECVPVDNDVPGRDPTPKQKLMNWVKNMLPPDLPISNFTTDWNDGRAIGALVNACAPGLYPDWEKQDPRNPLKNAKNAMDRAEEWLGVPQLIRPEEMIDPNVDDRSMMTYLSQFPNAKLKPGAPAKGRTSTTSIPATPQQTKQPIKKGPVFCYGKGIEPTGNFVNEPTQFFVDTSKTGFQAPVSVKVLNPLGRQEPCYIRDPNAEIVECNYTPAMEGTYRILVYHGSDEVPHSPFPTLVKGPAQRANSLMQPAPSDTRASALGPAEKRFPPISKKAFGPGIGKDLLPVNKPTWFEVERFGGSPSEQQQFDTSPEPFVRDPYGQTVPVRATLRTPNKVRYEYSPTIVGTHKVDIPDLSQSPYLVEVVSDSDPAADQCRAYGRGIQPVGIRTGDVADFVVVTPESGEGGRRRSSLVPSPLKVSVKGPNSFDVPCRSQQSSQQSHECAYVPQKPGPHQVNVEYEGKPIPQSPFNVMVAPHKESKIRAYGPGLEGGMVGHPADFMVETNDETGALGFSIEGPSETKIECSDNGDGSAKVRYWPTAPGEYAVHIVTDDEDIPNSPYMAWIDPASDSDLKPGNVRVYGPGVDPDQPHFVGKATEFTVDTHLAGTGNLKVSCADGNYENVDVQVRDNKNGTYTCRYIPISATPHTITVSYGQVAVPESPFKVNVREPSDPRRVTVYGPGLEDNVEVNNDTFFIVDCRDAGSGDVAVALMDPNNEDVPLSIFDDTQSAVKPKIPLDHGQYYVGYRPTRAGPHLASVIYAGEEIPQSPINVKVKPDLGQIQLEGDCLQGKPVSPNDPHKLMVHGIRKAGLDPSAVSCRVSQPSGAETLGKVEPLSPDSAAIDFNTTEEPGSYVVQPMAGEIALCPPVVVRAAELQPKAPLSLPIQRQQHSEPTAYGPGLHEAMVGRPAEFTVDTRGAAPDGQLKVTVEGPAETPIEYSDNQDGTCLVSYTPTLASSPQSPYLINITYNGKDIPGSPFYPLVKSLPALARAYGPGVDERNGIRASLSTFFEIDTSKCNVPQTNLHIHIGGLNSAGEETVTSVPYDLEKNSSSPFVHRVNYVAPPTHLATHVRVDIRLIDDRTCSVIGNPFTVPIIEAPPSHPSAARAYGDGLYHATTNKPAQFTVETSGAGDGGLNMLIEGPSEAGLACIEHIDAKCLMQYTPSKPGTYTLSIKFADEHIQNSPFSITCSDPIDASKVKVNFESESTRVGEKEKIIIDGSRGGGPGTPQVNLIDSRNGRCSIPISGGEQVTNNVYTAEFVPSFEGVHRFDVKWSDEAVPFSPFDRMVHPPYELSKIVINGPGVNPTGVSQSMPTYFDVLTDSAGLPAINVDVKINGPSAEQPVPTRVQHFSEYQSRVNYTPVAAGRHSIVVEVDGKPIPRSPLSVWVESSSNISSSRTSVLNSERTFILDEQRPTWNRHGGGGELDTTLRLDRLKNVGGRFSDLTAKILTPSGKSLIPRLEDNRDGSVSINYQPDEIGLHELSVRYCGEPISGSPFKFHVDSLSSSSLLTKGQAYAYGSGLSGGREGEYCRFMVVTKDAGSGGLSVAVEGPSKADIQCTDNKDGTCDVRWLPTASGEYIVSIKFADRHISGSPFTANVISSICGGSDSRICKEATMLRTISSSSSYSESLRFVGENVRIPVTFTSNSGYDVERLLTATVISPSGRQEACYLEKSRDELNTWTVTFVPTESGTHVVSVFRKDNGAHIAGSPFRVSVVEHRVEGGESSSQLVKVYGAGIERVEVGTPNTFFIDTSCVQGRGGLNISIEGPSKANIHCEQVNDDKSYCKVTYEVSEPGRYTLSIKFADCAVPGSPFVLESVGGSTVWNLKSMERSLMSSPLSSATTMMGTSNYSRRTVNCEASPSSIAEVGSRSQFSLRLSDVTTFSQLEATVTSPSGKVEPCDIEKRRTQDNDEEENRGEFNVSFVPRECGLHTISVKYRGQHVAGSPFPFTVGTLNGRGGAHKVRAAGPGLSRGQVNQNCEFNIYTREAGSGSINITVEGPSKAEVWFKNRLDGTCAATYTCTEPGQYLISIKFNDEHIPDSPFSVYVSGSEQSSGYRQLTSINNIYEQQQQHYSINKPLTFTVNFDGAPGNNVEAYVVRPDGSEDVCLVQQSLTNSCQHSMRFVPRQNGLHRVHVRLNGTEMAESPFNVLVGSSSSGDAPDAGRVIATGAGLHCGQAGVPCEFLVNTRNAGSGAFAVTVDGPSKVQLGCTETPDGYRVTFLPTAPGDYLISIKLAGMSIAGSPFKCHVSGSSEGSQQLVPGGAVSSREHSIIMFEAHEDRYSRTSVMESKQQRLQQSSSQQQQQQDTGPNLAKKVKSYGEALYCARANQVSSFTIDAANAGESMLMVGMHGSDASPCDEVLIKHMGNNVYNVSYTVRQSGRYVLVVKWGDCHIPGSPFYVEVP